MEEKIKGLDSLRNSVYHRATETKNEDHRLVVDICQGIRPAFEARIGEKDAFD